MENNLNPSLEPNNSVPMQVQSDPAPMQSSGMKPKNKHSHFIAAVLIIVLVGVGLIWYLWSTDYSFVPAEIKTKKSQNVNPQNEDTEELDKLNVESDNLDAEFKGIDNDLNSL